MASTPGRSHRTPAKHDLMDKLFGREVGVACRNMHDVKRLIQFDLTAGDGVVAPGLAWERNCSPGLLALHARHTNTLRISKPVTVYLHENARTTFELLMKNLDAHLPFLGYQRDGDEWVCGAARIIPVNDSGHNAKLDDVDSDTAVVASNDPNAITTWAMRDSFAMEVRDRTPYFQSINTLGCNPSGLKMLPQEARQPWFDLITQHHDRIPANHDLVLVRIDRDAAQWAYLLACPSTWHKRIEEDIRKAFLKIGATTRHAWMKREPNEFATMQNFLFLTKKEQESL